VILRSERPSDVAGIRTVHEAAFDSKDEAGLVDALRRDGSLQCSLVATDHEQILGHVASSLVRVEHQDESIVAGLAPVGVLPDHQRRGIGAALMEAIIEASREDGLAGLVLLGDPAYYGRFGFRPASDFNLRSHYTDGPAFQAMALRVDALSVCHGHVHYDPLFDELG
jgi:putative acetyltransferase